MRPSGIPLTWKPWTSARSCTPPAPETIAHSYLQELAHELILKTVVSTVSSLRGYCYIYMLIKLSYPYIFGILDYRSSESGLSRSDVCVSRIEGIKCLFRKDVVAKHDPSTLMIHGALYLRIGGGKHVYVLSRRTMRHRPYIRLLSRS